MLQLQSVVKKFGHITAVNNVSLTIQKREFFGLLGPNGAGKTTIIRMIMGFSYPSAGVITVNSTATTNPDYRACIGYLSEQHKIPPYLNGREYLKRHASLMHIPSKEAMLRIDAVIEKVGMQDKARMPARTYSKGMCQRIALAGALLNNPPLLLLDEPASGLDPLGIRDTRRLLEQLRDQGTTIFLNSHLLSEVEKVCDTVAIIHKGSILVKDTISSIVRGNETLEDVFCRYLEGKNA